MRASVDPQRLRAALEELPAPRVRSSRPEVMAAVDGMVLDAFTAAGWLAGRDEFQARNVWAWAPGGRLAVEPADSLVGVNVVAVKEGAVPEAVVVVAHHDTVPGSGGADDNGSGVVALLEVARLLGPLRFRRTVVLAAVDHEELGFHGSRRLVERLSAERPVLGAFVCEMLGYASSVPGSQQLPAGIGTVYRGQVGKVAGRDHRGDFLAVIYRQSAVGLATCFAEGLAALAGPSAPILLRAPTDLPLVGPVLHAAVPFARNFARSDHVSFWDAGLPAVQLTDTADFRNPHYHLPGDLPDTLDYGYLADVTAALALAVERLAEPAET
ncbi:MAG: M20/M25/M40 family metallo-hydrolase [Actinomycetota bacterium]|nr:M20/M25/M40 family metallo-hydrolase [Actinomycetota bacterium]